MYSRVLPWLIIFAVRKTQQPITIGPNIFIYLCPLATMATMVNNSNINHLDWCYLQKFDKLAREQLKTSSPNILNIPGSKLLMAFLFN